MYCTPVIASADNFLNLALLFGLIILSGTFGARLSQKIHVPQVVGAVFIGILLGDVSGLIKPETIEKLEPFTMFALGLIGFMIGGELRSEVFKKYGKQFFTILFSQGLGAFLFVAAGTSLAALLITEQPATAVALGLVFGAIASATAPAATANVLWEHKTRGPLTAAILAIVALDDALALLLYRAAATGAKALTAGPAEDSVLAGTFLLLAEIVGAILLGFLAALFLFYLLKIVKAEDKILEFTLASLLLVVGVSMIPHIDPILPAMVLGITLANLMPRQSKAVFKLVEKFSPPIYISFFVLAGAHMQFDRLTIPVIVMILVFIFTRAGGKILGCWFGARFSAAPKVVQKYLGICLLPQAGVSIGLAILASRQFEPLLGHTIIMIVMTAIFAMEILGPILVKTGVAKAGEIGLNVTEEDLIKTYAVKDVMDTTPVTITQDLPLHQILEVFSSTENLYYPVIDNDLKIIGIITVADIKQVFASQDVAGWLLACDVAEPVLDKTTPKKSLEEAVEHMNKFSLENLPVVESEHNDKLVGVLDYRKTLRKISAEVLRRRQMADSS
jgi:Kef-type K+ transport system membrane component KefB/predicted transcriptional regulator